MLGSGWSEGVDSFSINSALTVVLTASRLQCHIVAIVTTYTGTCTVHHTVYELYSCYSVRDNRHRLVSRTFYNIKRN